MKFYINLIRKAVIVVRPRLHALSSVLLRQHFICICFSFLLLLFEECSLEFSVADVAFTAATVYCRFIHLWSILYCSVPQLNLLFYHRYLIPNRPFVCLLPYRYCVPFAQFCPQFLLIVSHTRVIILCFVFHLCVLNTYEYYVTMFCFAFFTLHELNRNMPVSVWAFDDFSELWHEISSRDILCPSDTIFASLIVHVYQFAVGRVA